MMPPDAGDRGPYRAAVLTLSDRASRGEREDATGPMLRELVAALPAEVAVYEVLPDDEDALADRLCSLADRGGVDLVLTNGGTGLSPRDVTPEATRRVVEREVPGMAEAMRAASLAKTPRAMLSRAVCGVRGRTLIVNLPGSPRAARENLEVLLPALAHALDKVRGDPGECGRP